MAIRIAMLIAITTTAEILARTGITRCKCHACRLGPNFG